MRDRACVINFEHDIVWVSPLLSDTCINCNHPACAKRGSPFRAVNPNKLQLKCGDIVSIGVSRRAQLIQALIALFIPIAVATGGYFLAEPLAVLAGKAVTEGMRAASVLVCLLVSTSIITALTRSKLNLSKPVITAVLQKAANSSQNPVQGC